VVVAIKAMACELPAKAEQPLARLHCPDLARAAVESGTVASILAPRSGAGCQIKPWQHRSWKLSGTPTLGPRPPASWTSTHAASTRPRFDPPSS